MLLRFNVFFIFFFWVSNNYCNVLRKYGLKKQTKNKCDLTTSTWLTLTRGQPNNNLKISSVHGVTTLQSNGVKPYCIYICLCVCLYVFFGVSCLISKIQKKTHTHTQTHTTNLICTIYHDFVTI